MPSDNTVYPASSLTGGTAWDLDGYDGSLLVDGDFGIVVESGELLKVYRLNATSGASEDVPKVIAPDTAAGTKRWIMVSVLNKFDATTAPTANEDSGDGYAPGSLWVDITNDKAYVCLDDTATAAVWSEIGITSHTGLADIGTTSHADIDTHIADGTKHYLEASIDHTAITNIGSNAHSVIDTHLGSTSNPHSVTKAQVGLTNVADILDKFDATVAPTVNDDSNSSYSVGSYWHDITADHAYVCVDASVGAAVWRQISIVAHGDLADVGSNTHAQVDTHIADGTKHYLEAAIDHTAITNIGTNTHAQVDTHIATSNIHVVLPGTIANVLSDHNKANHDSLAINADTVDSVEAAAMGQLAVAAEWTATQNFNQTTLTDGATIDWALGSNQVAKVTLAGNRTMNAPTGNVEGATYVLEVIQDATGSRTLSWNAEFKWENDVAPTLASGASERTIIMFKDNGTNLYGSVFWSES
jgi:hypothetical protein